MLHETGHDLTAEIPATAAGHLAQGRKLKAVPLCSCSNGDGDDLTKSNSGDMGCDSTFAVVSSCVDCPRPSFEATRTIILSAASVSHVICRVSDGVSFLSFFYLNASCFGVFLAFREKKPD